MENEIIAENANKNLGKYETVPHRISFMIKMHTNGTIHLYGCMYGGMVP